MRANNPRFRAGQLIRVKSRESIANSLPETKILDGCLFMEQMWSYCGNTYPILRAVDTFFNEHKKRTLVPRAPVYMLSEIYCDGKVGHFPCKCDHGCLLLWHEEWLERAE